MRDKPEPNPEDYRVGVTIRAFRLRSGLTSAELGRIAGVSEPMMSAIERGDRRATPQVRRDIAEALHFPLAAIYAEAEAEQVA